MRVLITGAGGAVAGNLIRSGVLARHEILSVIRPGSEVPGFNDSAKIHFDLAAGDGLPPLCREFDVIIHAAGITPKTAKTPSDYAINIKIAETICGLLASEKPRQLIFLSTGSVYGTENLANDESDNCAPSDAYGKSMLECEKMFQHFSARQSIAIIRLFYPFGFDSQTEQKNMISRLYKKLLLDEEIVVSNKAASAFCQPIFIDDVGAIVARVIDSCYTGILNVSGQEKVTLHTLIEMLARIANRNPHLIEDEKTPAVIEANNQLLLSLNISRGMTPLAQALAVAIARMGA